MSGAESDFAADDDLTALGMFMATSTPGARLDAGSPSLSLSTGSLADDNPAEDTGLGPNARFLMGHPWRIADGSSSATNSTAITDDSFRTIADNSVDPFDFIVDVFKYVDDTTVVEAVDISGAIKHFTTATPVANSKARYTEKIANSINTRASEIGMKVNCKKTQLLLISPPNGFDNRSSIRVGGNLIQSGNKLKLLGYMFGQDPNAAAHL